MARQDRDTGRRIQAAYKAAWPQRGLGQDVSNSPLLDRLREEGVEEALDEASPLHQIIIGFWRKGVHPRRLKWELMKVAGRAILQLGDTGLTIRDAFKGEVRLHESWDLPDGRRGVGSAVEDPPSTWLNFERIAAHDGALRECLDEPPGLGGWRRPRVWLDMDRDDAASTVMVGHQAVGRALVPQAIWTRMIEAEATGLYADGTLEVKADRQGELATGTLICTYLPDGPYELREELPDDDGDDWDDDQS